MDLVLVLWLLPWFGLFGYVTFLTRFPTAMEEAPPEPEGPLVSVIVPARNEARSIEECLRSITRSDYPNFEVIVVDDRSEDDTFALASSVPVGNAERIEVVRGKELPDDWLGKPWACRQGAKVARGAWLLFTDADTVHGPQLISKAVRAATVQEADLFTVAGRQLVETFWEKLVQTQVFLTMLLRFPDFERTARNKNWRDAIANGQFLLFRLDAYRAISGHRAVRNEVVEDLALAQHVKRAGLALRIGGGVDDLSTRMYRSLRELIDGWSKNLVLGGQQTLPPWLRGVAAPATLVVGIVVWLAAPAVLLLWSAGGGFDFGGVDLGVQGETFVEDVGQIATDTALLTWAGAAYLLNTLTWGLFARRVDVELWYAPLHPLGAAVGVWIFARAWWRGRRVEWKGRSYVLPPVSERP